MKTLIALALILSALGCSEKKMAKAEKPDSRQVKYVRERATVTVMVHQRRGNVALVGLLGIDGITEGQQFILTNCPSDMAVSKLAVIHATKVGVAANGYEVWDCGETVK